MELQTIEIPPLTLEWSAWHNWGDFLLDARTDPAGLVLPNEPGVYEAKLLNTETRLTIGKTSNIRMRVKQGLVKGKVPHSSGQDIRFQEDTTQVMIRWALTARPAAVEEELHHLHKRKFGLLPKYTDRT